MYREVGFHWMAYLRTEGNFRLPPEPETEGGEGYGTSVHPIAKVDEQRPSRAIIRHYHTLGSWGRKSCNRLRPLVATVKFHLAKNMQGGS